MTRWHKVYDRLDALSRTRALTDQESALLERAIANVDGAEPYKAPSPWTEEETDKLLKLVKSGKTISQAGRELGKTRNSALGKWSRMYSSGAVGA